MESDGTRYTLDETLSAIGFGKFQGLALAYAGLGWISDAMEMMLLSFIGPALQTQWGISPTEESFLTTIVFMGMLVGAYLWGFISDAHGRKTGFIGAGTLIAGAGLLSAFSPGYHSLLIFRLFVGMGDGGAQVFATWFLEFVPTSKRGSWMVAISACWTIGTLLEASLAWIVMPRLGWRWLLGLSSIPSLSVVLLSSLVPESPRYLCSKGRTIDAQRVLERIARLNQEKLPAGSLVSDHSRDLDVENDPTEETILLSPTNKVKNAAEKYLESLFELFSPKLLRTTLLVWILYIGYTFSYYGIVLLVTEFSGQSECGSVTKNSENASDSSLYLDVFITSLAEAPGLMIVALVVDKIGRKLTMLILTILTFILMIPLLWHQDEVVTTALLFGSRMFISAAFSSANVYSKEVYPTSARTTGDGVANSMGRIGGMICPLVAVGLVRGCHQTAAVGLFEVVLLVSGLSVVLLPFETKGRNLADKADME